MAQGPEVDFYRTSVGPESTAIYYSEYWVRILEKMMHLDVHPVSLSPQTCAQRLVSLDALHPSVLDESSGS